MLFALQRRLIKGDTRHWRQVISFQPNDWEKVDRAVRLLNEVGWVDWRIVTDDFIQEEVARWSNGEWIKRGN